MKRANVYGGRWAKVRLSFLNENPLCAMCKEQGRITAATVVDHITPHRLRDALASGDTEWIAKAQKLFWDKKNFQSLCDPHHNSTKQRMEKSGVVVGCSEDGIPLDPNSHWNK
ncbi:TPA: HNH endonuclease [Providencia rettgeri]|nr:HNH endonuclease [Providencia rettgeri]